MRNHGAGLLRNHWHVLLVVPLVVIAITWPTFPRIFNGDEFWLHVVQHDKWLRIWDAWHFERLLAGQAELYYTDLYYHPPGLSLAFQAFVFPHALLMVVLRSVLQVDGAYNLLFLLILCFNAFCGYVLVRYLIKDKWIALFGTVVVAAATPFPYGSTVPDVILIGTLPLTIYYFLRSVAERSWLFAGFAGFWAGFSAFISVYVFAFILMTVVILASIKALSLWKQRTFWQLLLVFVIICGLVSLLRFYPMLADRANLGVAVAAYLVESRSNDVLEYFVLPNNPFTGELFRKVHIESPPGFKQEHKDAYLGYINLFLIACAIYLGPRRGRLLPWIVILIVFAILRLGGYLTVNGIEYTSIILPERLLSDWFPSLFRNIGRPEYYQIGVIVPLAVLSCFGLATLLRSKQTKTRMLIVILCTLIVTIEFRVPRLGETVERNKIAYISWLRSETDQPIKLINLPLEESGSPHYFLYLQTLTGYPQANGWSSRMKRGARHYINGNRLLTSWDKLQSAHCLPHNEPSFTAALEQLLADGFSHIVVHNWKSRARFIMHTFKDIPAAYDNGYVSIYRLRDLSLSCQNQVAELPRFIHFAQSSSAIPGLETAILSFHPSEAIDPDLFRYLGSLFSDWTSLLHLYQDNGELITQMEGKRYDDLAAFMNDNQVIHFLYNTKDTDPNSLADQAALAGFNLCQRETHDDGSIIELQVSQAFSCELVASDKPFQIQYDNGIRLEHLLSDSDQDALDLQLWWSSLPDEAHAVSIQVFDVNGAKALGQDLVIGHAPLARHRIDISSLAPGDYAVKLIVYNFESGTSIAGTVSEDGRRIDRAIEVATIQRN